MKKEILFTVLLVIVLVIAGCTSGPGQSVSQKNTTIVVGAKTFNEQYILSEMIAQILKDNGYQAVVKSGLNDGTLFEGIKNGQVGVYVEYTGTAYSQLLKLPALQTWDPDVVSAKVKEGLAGENITVLSQIGFRDDYTIAVREDWAVSHNNVSTISELVPYAKDLVFGSDLVFHEREDGLPSLQKVYGLTFKDVKPMSPTLMYEAIKNGQVDVIPPYTTDSRVDLYKLRTLRDDRSAMPPYHAILLANAGLAKNPGVVQALAVLNGKIDTTTMRELNRQFDIDKRDAQEIAHTYLVQQGIIKG
ncbi:glycine betaine ABC transporter substrate-binding protein [Methanosphaerula palustris]|uniref:Substrate-binding region of ABC-type glycine betaine transport system n=1 Tax=Methanosphaerula palustris (strain ATCC BAA-1556 / DSM 19958 / E1-9c) TaxID=521011 RepID=B8GHU4_METPE|nr:glycine betaine ABC transporter substrate-binding protein [Methanosphaerula palustris]ACL16684.1 Substrate-binding region of ABC-type glycine betaine transport system [Methanosphaerula palustris E1-9c]